MATGYAPTHLVAFDRGGAGSYVLAPLPQDERGLGHEWDRDSGAWAFVNADPISQSYGGHRQFSFLDDFYLRIYLIPQVLDYGAIVGTVTRDIIVWNAYFTPVTLQSITANIGDEVTLGDDPALPNAIPALTLRSWSFTVTPEGPPTLDESFTWTFDTGEVFELPVTGQRSVLWPFLPNWTDSFTVTREFLTDVLVARSGREQRIANREYPRKSMEFLVTLQGEKLREYRRLMTYWQDRPFIVSDISRNVSTETALLSGGTTVTVDEADAIWLTQEDRAVVLVSGDQVGLRVIDNIDDSNNLLTFKDTDGFNWPIGTKIYAGVVANLNDERRLSRPTNNLLHGRVTFNVLPGTEIVEDPPAAPVMFNDRELFLHKPNWGNTPENTDRHPTEYVDYGIGRLSRFSPITNPTIMWQMSYVGRDAANIQELVDVFERAKGRQGEFYMPTWESDLTAKFDLNAGSLGLRVEGLDILQAHETDDTARAVMVELHDGTRIFRVVDEIIDIEDVEGHDTLINMTQVWGTAIDKDDIAMISWVRCWRFSTDDLTAEFLTNSVAQLQITVQSLEDLPAESEESSNSP